MPRGNSIWHKILCAATFILMEIAALNLLHNNGTLQNFFLSKAVHSFMATVWGGSERLASYFSLRKANDALAQENFDLMLRLRRYEAETKFQKADSIAASFPDVGQFHFVPASIVKSSRNKEHNYMIIDKGGNDGVLPHSGIISVNGAVGIIDAVGENYSYALSFNNSELSISARIGDEGAVGPLVWAGTSPTLSLLKDIPLQYKFQPGDTVYTSGFSSIFPADIPLGMAGESRIVNGATYEIKVELFQDPGAARYVTVVNNLGRAEIESLEKQAQ